jgi:hypothetical protein
MELELRVQCRATVARLTCYRPEADRLEPVDPGRRFPVAGLANNEVMLCS